MRPQRQCWAGSRVALCAVRSGKSPGCGMGGRGRDSEESLRGRSPGRCAKRVEGDCRSRMRAVCLSRFSLGLLDTCYSSTGGEEPGMNDENRGVESSCRF